MTKMKKEKVERTLLEYYSEVKSIIESGEYTIKMFNDVKINNINPHLEAIHYLMVNYWIYRKDERLIQVFDFVIVPNIKLNREFEKWEINKFLHQVMMIKD